MTPPIFVNSAMVRAPERLVLRGGSWRWIDLTVRYGVWQHPVSGPVLIDTGYGERVTHDRNRSTALRVYTALLRPSLVASGAPVAWLRTRGIVVDAVKHIVVTHFHPDHIAGLRDFPRARFLASGEAFQRLTALGKRQQWHHGFFPELLPEDFAARLLPIEALASRPLPFRLGRGFDLFGDGSCFAVPLPGHALGHFGLLWPDEAPPLLYGADSQWLLRAIREDRSPRGVAQLIYSSRTEAARSSARLRHFLGEGGRLVLCHDPGDDADDDSGSGR